MKELIEELKKKFIEHEKRISKLESIIYSINKEGYEPVKIKKLSVKEFLRSINIHTDVQKTLAIGYYLERHEKMTSFNVSDILNGFRSAKEPIPSNLHAFINHNIKNGHIMDYEEKKDNKKAYILTSTGETFIESFFK